MIGDRPLYHGKAGVMLDCTNPACDICNLGPGTGETREGWIARLRDRFACQPIPHALRPVGPTWTADEWETLLTEIGRGTA